MIGDGVKCTIGAGGGVDMGTCGDDPCASCGADHPIIFWAYASVDFWCYFFGLWVIQRGGASLMVLASAIALPLQQFVLVMPFLGKWKARHRKEGIGQHVCADVPSCAALSIA